MSSTGMPLRVEIGLDSLALGKINHRFRGIS